MDQDVQEVWPRRMLLQQQLPLHDKHRDEDRSLYGTWMHKEMLKNSVQNSLVLAIGSDPTVFDHFAILYLCLYFRFLFQHLDQWLRLHFRVMNDLYGMSVMERMSQSNRMMSKRKMDSVRMQNNYDFGFVENKNAKTHLK